MFQYVTVDDINCYLFYFIFVYCSGAALIFVFGAVLMIAVIILFITGGASYTEVCRPALDRDPPAGFIKVSQQSVKVTG